MNSDCLITEGALVERLKSEFSLDMDPHVNHAGLIYEHPEILGKLYRQYIESARKHNLPIMLMTPTRRLNFETLRKSRFSDRNIIADSCIYLKEIRNEYPDFGANIFIGGLLGSKGDAFRADEALDTSEAYEFHKIQVAGFQAEKVDFLFAGIMPVLSEAIGMARAMAESGIPYMISFSIRKNGCLLDGTSIAKAIRIIDQEVSPRPISYLSNCVHPLNLQEALKNPVNSNSPQLSRFMGIQANASSLSPEELNNCGILHQENFDGMIDRMIDLKKTSGIKMLGGCCGTDDVFIEKLAERLALNNT
ncbi:MAG: homocysteine S-methyltransferase family protein [Prolixibacteraceae bacterium]